MAPQLLRGYFSLLPANISRAAWFLPGVSIGPMLPGTDRDPEKLLRLANARMPSGRYAGELLLDLPEEYVLWFANRVLQGAAAAEDARTGVQLAAIHEIRFNGLEGLLRPLIEGASDDEGEQRSLGVPTDELDWLLDMISE